MMHLDAGSVADVLVMLQSVPWAFYLDQIHRHRRIWPTSNRSVKNHHCCYIYLGRYVYQLTSRPHSLITVELSSQENSIRCTKLKATQRSTMSPDNIRRRPPRFHKGRRVISKIKAVIVVSAVAIVKVIAPKLLVPLATVGMVRVRPSDKK